MYVTLVMGKTLETMAFKQIPKTWRQCGPHKATLHRRVSGLTMCKSRYNENLTDANDYISPRVAVGEQVQCLTMEV